MRLRSYRMIPISSWILDLVILFTSFTVVGSQCSSPSTCSDGSQNCPAPLCCEGSNGMPCPFCYGLSDCVINTGPPFTCLCTSNNDCCSSGSTGCAYVCHNVVPNPGFCGFDCLSDSDCQTAHGYHCNNNVCCLPFSSSSAPFSSSSIASSSSLAQSSSSSSQALSSSSSKFSSSKPSSSSGKSSSSLRSSSSNLISSSSIESSSSIVPPSSSSFPSSSAGIVVSNTELPGILIGLLILSALALCCILFAMFYWHLNTPESMGYTQLGNRRIETTTVKFS